MRKNTSINQAIAAKIARLPIGQWFDFGDYDGRSRWPARAYIRLHGAQLGWTVVNDRHGHYYRTDDFSEVVQSSKRGAGHSYRQLRSSLGDARLAAVIAYQNGNQAEMSEASALVRYYEDVMAELQRDPLAAATDY